MVTAGLLLLLAQSEKGIGASVSTASTRYDVASVKPGVFPPRHYEITDHQFKITNYAEKSNGGLRTVEYALQSRSDSDVSFIVTFEFLTFNGAVQAAPMATKGQPVYTGNGEGPSQWMYVESKSDASGTYVSRFNPETPHFSDSTPDAMIKANGSGRAVVTRGRDGRYSIRVTTYLFSKADRRSFYLLAANLVPN